MKKILFIGNGLSSGGAERVISLLSNSLVEDEYDVTILYFVKSDKKYSFNPKVKTKFIDLSSKKNKKIGKILAIKNYLKSNKVDTIIVFSNYNIMLTVLACYFNKKIKIIGSERNDPAQLKNRKFINLLRNILYRRLDKLVCQTEDAKNYFPTHIRNKTVVIMNPINNKLPNPYKGDRRKQIISFCRIEPQKNIKMMINAFKLFNKEFDDYQLLIYGDGSKKQEMISYVKELNLDSHIKFFPFDNDIYNIANECSLFLLTSDYEGLSNSMLESLAMGIPTIVTDCPCGGAKMVIKDGFNGFLVPVGDYKYLAEKMIYLMKNPKVSEEFSKNSIYIKDKLDYKNICKEWINVIEEEK